VVCPLCGEQKARRSCPALDRQICPTCCGTKRLTEISCPGDCVYLAAAREHPPAAAVRRRKQDIGTLAQHMRDLNEQQSELFFLLVTFLLEYQPPELGQLIDSDVAEATATVAATFETAARGVIYEHRAASLPAERLAISLKPMLMELERAGGSTFQRDGAVVLRRVAAAAAHAGTTDAAANRHAFLDLIGRVLQLQKEEASDPGGPASKADDGPRIIIP
jgi:hypothetical protein